MVSIPRISEPPLEKLPPKSSWRPLRIVVPILLLAGMVVFRFVPQIMEDPPAMVWAFVAFGPALCGILILLWWLTWSGATWTERIVGFLGIVGSLALTLASLDPSMRGPSVPVMTIPMGMAGFAIGAILFSRSHSFHRVLYPLYLALLGFGFSTLFRTEGMWGTFNLGLDWRWVQSPESKFMTRTSQKPDSSKQQTIEANRLSHPQWPEFRGPKRDGVEHGTRIAMDWTGHPPELLWKVPAGPSWSSFSVADRYLFTQEQRGPMETVVCYNADNGSEVWTQQIESRFNDPLGGPGPRATPTLADGSLYVAFATGILARLDAYTGKILWKVDLYELSKRKPLVFGYSTSPLVIDSLVIAYAGGEENLGVLALSKETGKLAWTAPSGEHSYSSPQLSKVMGETTLLMLSNHGLSLLEPLTGKSRLHYPWKCINYRSCQPQVISDDSVLLPTGLGTGTRRIQLVKTGDQLEGKELWTTRLFRPDFNDLVVFQGHAYGFDDKNLACINLETGKRTWKGPDFGKGQVLLLENSGLILLISEEGELVLVKCDPSSYTQLGKIQALEGKTWNHPVVIGDRLYLRNSQQIACYQLPLANAATTGNR